MPDQVIYSPPPDQPQMILVGVAGAVAHPGLYWLPQGATVADALSAAGGPRGDADLSRLDLSRRVRNNEMINVLAKPRPPDYSPLPGVNTRRVTEARIVNRSRRSSPKARRTVANPPPYRINVNTAGPNELERLPGIGPTLARRIVEYRSLHGPFRSLKDLEGVSGIGPKKAAQLAPYISF